MPQPLILGHLPFRPRLGSEPADPPKRPARRDFRLGGDPWASWRPAPARSGAASGGPIASASAWRRVGASPRPGRSRAARSRPPGRDGPPPAGAARGDPPSAARRSGRAPRSSPGGAPASGPAVGGAGDGQRDRQVGSRLLQPHAADDVHEHVGSRRFERPRGGRGSPAPAPDGCGAAPRPRAGAARAPSGAPAPGPRPATAGTPPSSPAPRRRAARVASATKRAEASSTSASPSWRISNRAASLVEPKRFFSARSSR